MRFVRNGYARNILVGFSPIELFNVVFYPTQVFYTFILHLYVLILLNYIYKDYLIVLIKMPLDNKRKTKQILRSSDSCIQTAVDFRCDQ